MRAATRSAARSFPAPSRPFSSSPRVQRAGGWDNKPRPGEDSLAHALKSLSSRTRLTRPQTEAYTAIFKQASRLADRHDFNNSTQSRTFRPDDSNLDSLPFDVVMTAMAEADSSRLTLEHDALAYISYFAKNHPSIIPSLLVQAIRDDNHPADLYEALALQSNEPEHPEQLVYIMLEMLDRELQPSTSLIRHTIRACCEWGMPRLALDLVRRIEDVFSYAVDLPCWVDILLVSAERHYLDGVLASWARVTRYKRYTPDSGLVSRILDVAARAGHTDLATQALAALGTSGASVEEHHLAALLECYVAAGQVPEAFRVVSSIRANDLSPTISTVEPIAAVLTTPELIDTAFYGLEDMHKAGQPVDIASVNALILASARIKDLRRVRATQAAISDLDLKPDIDTFNTVLDGCIQAEHRALGDTVLAEMQAAGVAPTAETYEKLIHLCLLPDTYEDAFYYLEKMKAEDMRPSVAVYQAILRKCLRANDRRWELTLTFVEKSTRDVNEFAYIVGDVRATSSFNTHHLSRTYTMESLSPACTPIKQRYDACFNAWFEGYLQPALDTANRARQSMPGPRSPGAPQVDNVADPTVPKRIITNWSSAFRRRDYSKAAVPPDTTTDEAPTFQHVPSQLPPIDPRGKTRAQIKAEEYDRNCGSAWREYNACLKIAIAENPSLSALLESARAEHPLSRLDGVQGTQWDANAKLET